MMLELTPGQEAPFHPATTPTCPPVSGLGLWCGLFSRGAKQLDRTRREAAGTGGLVRIEGNMTAAIYRDILDENQPVPSNLIELERCCKEEWQSCQRNHKLLFLPERTSVRIHVCTALSPARNQPPAISAPVADQGTGLYKPAQPAIPCQNIATCSCKQPFIPT
ncbi:uncharacterized protein LOC133537579 isoform X3 [Nerophis ophidion]|uniref:uncharacterized protein LOC133537579 isoform X3 n=1 Tax=Nerophis ophidion TaxID=159077 RepID=UPI002AE07DC7|nr:uncharacterized protein LOC133537579 isoform X3 [Nerophis ophidion]